MSKAMSSNSDSSTRGHNLVQAPSFPLGSISEVFQSNSTVWKAKNRRYSHYDHPTDGSYVGITYDQQLWQIIELPVEAAVEGRPEYWLGCEYDAGAFKECWLRVYDADKEGGAPFYEGVMQGKPPLERVLPNDEALSFIPPKPDATWHVLSERRIKIPKGVRRLRAEFETPDQLGPVLYLRKVTSHLRLPGFNDASELQLVVERPGNGPIVQSERPFLLCHGATHRLQVKVPIGDSWEAQKASLLWMGTDQLPIEYGLEAEPRFNRGGDEEERYQPLASEDGASWRLTANATLPKDLPPDLPLGIGSYWQAEKHPIAAKIGDYHHIIEKIEWDGVVPVVAENSTELTAIVKNPFAPDRPVVGQEVIWSYKGKQHVSQTDADGRAKLEYTPVHGDAGDLDQVVFTAQCEDALQQTSSAERTLPVFDESPWLKQVELTLDGKPVADLTALALRLTRGTRHTLTLKPTSAESYFVGKDIALSWPEEPKLGITLEPKADVAQTMGAAGINWTIQGGTGISGQFTLHAREVADAGLQVPLSLEGMQLSANLADEAELKVAAAGTDGPNIFRRGTDRAISLVPLPQSPLANAKLQGWLTFVQRGLSQDKVVARPNYSEKTSIGTNTTWTLKGADVSGVFGVQVHVEGLQPLALDNAMLLSLDLSHEVELKVAGGAPGSPTIFRRGQGKTISFVARAGSPLKGAGLKFWLAFDTRGTLAESDVTAVPRYKQTFTDMNSPAWTLTGGATSGTFGVQLHMDGFTKPVVLSEAMLLSLNVHDEIDLTVDGHAPTETMIFRRNTSRAISFKPKPNSPLGQSKLKYKLVFDTSGSLTDQQVKSNPSYGSEYDGYTNPLWTITGQNVSGTFGVQLHMEGFTTPYKTAHWLLLSENVEDEYDLTTKDPAVGGVVHFWRGQAQAVLLKPKAASPLSKGPTFKGQLKFVAGKGVPQDKVLAQPGYDQSPAIPDAGHTWTLTGKEVSGTFGLQVHVEGFKTPASLASNVLMSTKLADEAVVTLDGSDKLSPALFRRNTAGKVLLKPRSTSPLGTAVTPQAWMAFVTTGATLTAAQVPADPKYTSERSITAAGLEWRVTGVNVSGLFGIALHVKGFEPITVGNCGLLSSTMKDEMGLRASWRDDLPPGLMSPEHSTVVHAPSSPLVKLGAQLRLDFLPEGASCILKERPARGEWVKMSDTGRVKWLLTGSVMDIGWVQGRITSTLFPGDTLKLPPFYVGWNPEEAGPAPEDKALAQQGANQECPL